jgi:hypothetical protein
MRLDDSDHDTKSHGRHPDEAPSAEPEPVGPDPDRQPAVPDVADAGSTETRAAAADEPGPNLDGSEPALFLCPCSAAVAPDADACASCGRVRCWSKRCQGSFVERGEKAGHCGVCGVFLRDNADAIVTGLRSKKLRAKADAYRVDLLNQLIAERGGLHALDTVSRIVLENFALVCAQQKIIEARLDESGIFTQTGRRRSAFDMLTNISATIERLRAQLPPHIDASGAPADLRGIDATPDSALQWAHRLISRQTDLVVKGDALPDRELGQLDVLQALLSAQIRLPQDAPDVMPAIVRRSVYSPDAADETMPVVRGRADDHAAIDASDPRPTPVETRCPYGCGSLTKCAANKTDRLAIWQALHFRDPEEIERRTTEATLEMIARVGKASPLL